MSGWDAHWLNYVTAVGYLDEPAQLWALVAGDVQVD